jgi:hypothetical protein
MNLPLLITNHDQQRSCQSAAIRPQPADRAIFRRRDVSTRL